MNINSFLLTTYYIFSGLAILKHILYLLLSPFYNLNCRKYKISAAKISQKDIEKSLKISVIVPAWNEEVGIITSIKSLLANSYRRLEIIVINDGSTDATDKIIRNFKKSLKVLPKGKSFKYINKRKNAGKGSALNTGIKNSTGDLIITMDADTRFEKDAILNVARYFIDSDIDAAVGNVKIANSKNFLGLIQQIEYTYSFYFKRLNSILNCEYIIGGAFGIFRKKVFKKCGYFDEEIKTEDIEFSFRLKDMGIKTIFIEEAIAFTEGPSSIKELFKQRSRWKKGKLDTFYKYSNLFFSSDKKHNKVLSWFILPTSLLGDVELLLFPILTPLIFYHTFDDGILLYLLGWIFFITSNIMISYLFGSKLNSWKSFLLIPIFYIVAYLLILAETYALISSIHLYLNNSDITWQKWNRKGVENV